MTKPEQAKVFNYAELPPDWAAQPCLIRGAPSMGRQDVYELYVRSAKAILKGEHPRPDDVKVFTTPPSSSPLEHFLPSPTDSDFFSYAKRVSNNFSTGWSVVANSAQLFSEDLYNLARNHLVFLREHGYKLAAGVSDCFVVAGSYESGPTRIHKDTAAVFLFVAEGSKTMLLWPYDELLPSCPNDVDPEHEYVALRIDAADVSSTPIRLTGEPGDLLYWPESYWHCAESDGKPSLSLHVAQHRWRSMGAVWAGAFARAGLGDQTAMWTDAELSPVGVDSSFAENVAATAKSIVQQWSITRHSTANFEILPPFGAKGKTDWSQNADSAELVQRSPVSWANDINDPESILIAINGVVLRVQHCAATVSFLSEIEGHPPGTQVDLRPWKSDIQVGNGIATVLEVGSKMGAIRGR